MALSNSGQIRKYRNYDGHTSTDDEAYGYAKVLYIYENVTNMAELSQRINRHVHVVQKWAKEGFWFDKRRQNIRGQYSTIQRQIGKPEYMPLLAAKGCIKGIKLVGEYLDQQPSMAQLKQLADILDTFNVTTDRVRKQLKYNADIFLRKDGGGRSAGRIEDILAPSSDLKVVK